MTSFAIGSLVHVRGRDWVVLPGSDDAQHLLLLRPLGGSDDEIAGLHTLLEPPAEARFAPPDPKAALGNHRSSALLREATRLGFRSTAGPFRSLGHLAVDPRPYQLVPLLMAMKLDPVRLLIADDVGIGKTIEASLIAREMLDRGEIRRTAVLCPPHLAEQWQRALRDQFHLDAELLLPGTVARLERGCEGGKSVFQQYDHLVVSIDFIKSDGRRNLLLDAPPDLLIVDEAHGCSSGGPGKGQQQRHALLHDLLKKHPALHLLLVSATPHSGKPEQFRSLLALLGPDLGALPDELEGKAHENDRRRLAAHFVQRRRADLKDFLDEETPFPTRAESDATYQLTPAYRTFLDDVLVFCQKRVDDPDADADGRARTRQRVQWWATLALLRAVSSSPAAAVATLLARAAAASAETEAEADEAGKRLVLDQTDEGDEALDADPGASLDPPDAELTEEQRELRQLAQQAENLQGLKKDPKLATLAKLVASLLAQGHQPILFCRFIATADYVARELAQAREFKNIKIESVTGALAPEEREARILALGEHPRRLLVATDCLSEGVNLQKLFDAVVHYDLSWSITRHEQREGRVDRFGQPNPRVQAVTLFGDNQPIDGLVLRVLLRKHQAIRKALGVALPVPVDEADLLGQLYRDLLKRAKRGDTAQRTFNFDADPLVQQLDLQWTEARERAEKKSQTFFAQQAIGVGEVRAIVEEIRASLGPPDKIEAFLRECLPQLGVTVTEVKTLTPSHHVLSLDAAGTRPAVQEAIGQDKKPVLVTFREPSPPDVRVLRRSDPLVGNVARHVLEAALDPTLDGPARRCCVVRTADVDRRTLLLLLRLRFQLHVPTPSGTRSLLVEDAALLALRDPGTGTLEPLDDAATEKMLSVKPSENVPAHVATAQLEGVLGKLFELTPLLEQVAQRRAQAVRESHERVRQEAKVARRGLKIDHYPPDVLGVFVYVPVLKSKS